MIKDYIDLLLNNKILSIDLKERERFLRFILLNKNKRLILINFIK